ncbi:sigma-70 family RNA polymerase sigma factor [Pandoraea terrigena]|uniref:ECF subfamily RNA polymerase sigma factor n=1 Tax=Pandoraea terrigena TaxID=2508292 RepID=A0A5E4UTW4_9BURK|nr:sigma-70 family RNA polymerase sigma factor [Pandoraea terrigena]VVE03412.1 ECF subfamily RNA polymerase sigma factor [Pandoraea terrigena]
MSEQLSYAGCPGRGPAGAEATEDSVVGQIFVTHRRALVGTAMRILGCPCRAEDVVQDAYIKLCDARSTCPVRHPASYVMQVVRNLALDGYRRQQIENRVFAVEDEAIDMPDRTASPEAQVTARQMISGMLERLKTLPERTRTVFEMYYFQDCTQREIAQSLGVSTTLVNFMMHDARQALTPWMSGASD